MPEGGQSAQMPVVPGESAPLGDASAHDADQIIGAGELPGTAELILMSVVERIVFADNGADGWIGHVCLFLCGRESLPILANLFLFKAAKMRYNLGVG